jgi:ribosomal protein S13
MLRRGLYFLLKETTMASASMTPAAKAAKLREMAKDKTLPQDVRNTYLDEANKLEEKAAKGAGVKLAKGGMPIRGDRTATMKFKKMVNSVMANKKPMMASSVMPEQKKPDVMPEKKPMTTIGVMPKNMPMMAKGGVVKELPKRGQRTATNMAKGGSVAKKAKK